MAWIFLCIAGLLKVTWVSLLSFTDSLRRPLPTFAFLALPAWSTAGLGRATHSIPIGTDYSVWVGIGAVGAAAYRDAAV